MEMEEEQMKERIMDKKDVPSFFNKIFQRKYRGKLGEDLFNFLNVVTVSLEEMKQEKTPASYLFALFSTASDKNDVNINILIFQLISVIIDK